MSCHPPLPERPRISAILDDISREKSQSTSLSPIAAKSSYGNGKIFNFVEPATQTDSKAEILLDFTKLPKEILLIILKILEKEKETITLNALTRTCWDIYELANPFLYRNIRLRDLASSYLLFCTIISHRRVAISTRSLYSDVQWFDHHPFHADPLEVRPPWRRKAEHKIKTELYSMCNGILSYNAFQSWQKITTLLIFHMPNMQELHLPRYFEAIDRGSFMNTTITDIPRFLHQVANTCMAVSKPGSPGSNFSKDRLPLTKLRVLNLLPDSAAGWNYFRARSPAHMSCFNNVKPFLRIRSIKVLRTVLDERIQRIPPQQPVPATNPTIERQFKQLKSAGTVHLEELELFARWTSIGGANDHLGAVVGGMGKGSLKRLKLSWLQENIYPNYMIWLAPNHSLRTPQTILRPVEILRSLRCVASTLEELVLPESNRVQDTVFSPSYFAHVNVFPKLRVLQGSMETLFGRNFISETELRGDGLRGFFGRWLELAAPSALERLIVKTSDGKVPSELAEALSRKYNPVVEEECS